MQTRAEKFALIQKAPDVGESYLQNVSNPFVQMFYCKKETRKAKLPSHPLNDLLWASKASKYLSHSQTYKTTTQTLFTTTHKICICSYEIINKCHILIVVNCPLTFSSIKIHLFLHMRKYTF